MPLWHPQLWQILQMHTCVESKIPVSLEAVSNLQCQSGGEKKGTTYPLGLPWLFCGTLMEEAFLNTSWRLSSVAAYERLLTIKVFCSTVGKS